MKLQLTNQASSPPLILILAAIVSKAKDTDLRLV